MPPKRSLRFSAAMKHLRTHDARYPSNLRGMDSDLFFENALYIISASTAHPSSHVGQPWEGPQQPNYLHCNYQTSTQNGSKLDNTETDCPDDACDFVPTCDIPPLDLNSVGGVQEEPKQPVVPQYRYIDLGLGFKSQIATFLRLESQ